MSTHATFQRVTKSSKILYPIDFHNTHTDVYRKRTFIKSLFRQKFSLHSQTLSPSPERNPAYSCFEGRKFSWVCGSFKNHEERWLLPMLGIWQRNRSYGRTTGIVYKICPCLQFCFIHFCLWIWFCHSPMPSITSCSVCVIQSHPDKRTS